MLPLQVDRERFFKALEAAKKRDKAGIGTQNEKLVHATLKNYFYEEGAVMEAPVGSFVADLLYENEIFEIQTSSFSYLKRKLPALLAEHEVTVVCPLMRQKTLYWIDPQSGALGGGRKSPKRGQPCHLLHEMFYLADFIGHPRFRIVIFLYDGEEYKLADGWSRDGKRGAHRKERVPIEVVDLFEISSEYDLALLLPRGCPPVFTTKEFSRLSSLRGLRLGAALKLLLQKGVVAREKKNRAYEYTVNRKEFIRYEFEKKDG